MNKNEIIEKILKYEEKDEKKLEKVLISKKFEEKWQKYEDNL